MKKLTMVKENAKCWNREVFGNLELSKKEVSCRIKELDVLEVQGGLAKFFRRERSQLRLKLDS